MISSKNTAPRFLRGISVFAVCLIILSLFVSCVDTVSSWGTDRYGVEYDPEVFIVQADTKTTLELVLEDAEQKAYININAVYPFTYSDEDGVDMYIDSAVNSFEQNYSRISNKSEDIQTQKGVTVKTLSISGDADDYDGVVLGMMKMLVSDKTLMHIEVVGNAQLVKKNMKAVQNLLESAKLGE